MIKNLNLTGKLILSIGIVVLISFVSTVSVITMKATSISKKQAMNEIDAVSKEFANQIRLDIETAFGTARSLSYATQNMKKTNKLADRNNLLAMMEGMLKNNPEYLGIWTVWEPNAFDGEDRNYQAAPGHTDQGRFAPYWNRVGGVHLETCVDLDAAWYTKARDAQKEVIMDPFKYEVGGETIMLISVCVPIVVDGQSLGVAGVDFSMKQIANLVNDISLYETGYAVLATESGMITAHPDKNNVGKSVNDVYPDKVTKLTKNSEKNFTEFALETTEEEGILTVNKIQTGETGTPPGHFSLQRQQNRFWQGYTICVI